MAQGLTFLRVTGIVCHEDFPKRRNELLEKLQPLRGQLGPQAANARYVPARPGEALDEAELHRIVGLGEYDGNHLGCFRAGLHVRAGHAVEEVRLLVDQFRRQLQQPGRIPLRGAHLETDGSAFDIAKLPESVPEAVGVAVPGRVGRCQDSYPIDLSCLLRFGSERRGQKPQSHCADECAPVDRCEVGVAHDSVALAWLEARPVPGLGQ